MKITTQESDAYAVLLVEGSLSVENRAMLEKYLHEYADNKHIIMDLSKVTFIDSSSLGVFVLFYSIFQKNNKHLILSNINDSIFQMFTLTGINKRIKIIENLENAIEYITRV